MLWIVAPNLLNRRFKASKPNEKWVTDVTEFRIKGEKLYLSPIVDLFNGEVVSYEASRRPLFPMIDAMLRKGFARLGKSDAPLLHSDQGWQYTMPLYRELLVENRLTLSMSRKGNCYDNATAESFFARHGYASADRDDAPPAIRATREFSGICPASSAFMRKLLQA